MKYDIDLIVSLCDGKKSSKEIAQQAGCPQKYVQKLMVKHDLPRLKQGAAMGSGNPAFVCGRKIDRDGYALVSAPPGHPHARYRNNRNVGQILEHRLVVEQQLGRHLLPSEIVDHIDGLHLHNCPSNLRVFESNKAHLQHTISGRVPRWSKAGFEKMQTPHALRSNLLPVDTYHQRKKLGEIRLLQILQLWLKPSIDNQFLLGTHHHLDARQIDYSTHQSLERALADLYQKWEQDH